LVESFLGETENYDALNPDTGEPVRSFAHSCGPDAVIEGGLVIGGFGPRLTAMSRSTGRLVWSKDFGEDPGAWVAGALAATPTQVIVGIGDGVTAFGVADGRERFHASFDDLTAGSKSTGRVRGPVVVVGDSALVELTSGFLVAVSLRDGQRRWVVEGGALDGYLYRDRYYRVSPRRYQIVDPSSGRLLLERVIRLPPALVREAGSPDRPILVSETHVFTGSRTGFVLAFERESGKYAWSTRPKGARGTYYTANYFTTARGRLIYGDVSGTIFCLGQPEGGAVTKTSAESTRSGRRRVA
jgi:outer membrane protein assembly factor BamB